MPRKTQHGGKRTGAGRPPLPPEERVQGSTVTLRLTPEARAALDRLVAFLELTTGERVTQGEAVSELLVTRDGELRAGPKRRKGPSAVVV